MSYFNEKLGRILSPIILNGNTDIHYRDPAAIYHDGALHLFFTVNIPRNDSKSMVSFIGTTKSLDLVTWTPVRLLTTEDPSFNFSSPGNIIRYRDEWIMCLCSYPIPTLDGYIADDSARAFIMRSKNLETWSAPEVIKLKGPDVEISDMGRIIDPYIFEDKDEPGKWWCSYKQNGASFSYSYDLDKWTYKGRKEAGENICILVKDNEYHMFHCPGADGMGLMRSPNLKDWLDVVDENIMLGYRVWPWAAARLTAACVLDLRSEREIGKYLMFFHGTRSADPHEHIGECSLGLAWSDDLVDWDWPDKNC